MGYLVIAVLGGLAWLCFKAAAADSANSG